MQKRFSLAAAFLIALAAGIPVFAEKPVVATAATTTPAKATAWSHESSDIAVDPAVKFGALPNGMRYAILKNAEPPGRVSLRMHIDAGSLQEAEDQRGVAHFLEHMVFNGSRNFPDVENLLAQMQRLGIAFGAHANAYTSFDETVYMLDLPNLDEDTVTLGFDVMRDFADGAFLKKEEIDKERGVILSEKRSRDSVQMRLMEQQFKFLMPDFLVTHRFPIGTEEVIESAPRERFADFYSKHYIPSKMTFVVVGDIDPAAYEQRIIKAFSSMKDPATTAKPTDLGKMLSGFEFKTAVFADKEVSSDEVSLIFVQPYERKPDTVANRLEKLPLNVANAIIGRRFDILSKKEGAPISSGSCGRFTWFNEIEFGSADVTPVEGKWKEAVPVLEQELRRAVEHGFTEAELEEIKASILNGAEQAVKRAPTRQSSGLAMGLISSINDERTFTHPEESLRITKKGLETLTVEQCHQALAEFWKDRDISLVLTTKEAPADGEKILKELYDASRAVEVAPPTKEETAAFAYTDFGKPGTVASQSKVEDLDITQLVFSNNVRVNLKRTDFQKNTINCYARFGNGKLTQPKDKPGLDMFAGMVMNMGGLGKHSIDELQRILAGRNVGGEISVDDDAFVLSGRTTPEDLELQLQLMCAGLTDPGYREEAVRQFRKMVPMIESQLKFTLNGAMADMQEWMRGGDGRFAKPDTAQLAAYDTSDVKEWISKDLTDSYMELSLVGDFDLEAVIPLLLKTVGALPVRASTKPALSEEREITTPEFPTEKSFSYESKIAKAASLVGWKIPSIGDDIKETRRLNVLASILDDRLREKLREELGATYSPQAHANPSDVFTYGTLSAMSLGKPEDAEKVSKLIIEMGEELAEKGATADEFDRAIKPIQTNLVQTLRENGYWLGTVLAKCQEQPKRLEWARNRDTDYGTVTLEEINALAKKYLFKDNAARVTITNTPPTDGKGEEKSE